MTSENLKSQRLPLEGFAASSESSTADAAVDTSAKATADHILVLQWVTVAWMLVECSLALQAAMKAKSASLLAFGSDSFVELISASVVLLQFAPRLRISQLRAAKLSGLLLYALAVIVIAVSTLALINRREADTSPLGIGVTCAALVLMPVLAGFKKKEAQRTGNKALRADAVQSATCAYLAALTLAGLLLRLLIGVVWLDGIVALGAVPILIVEGRRARRGHVCSHC